MYKQLVFFLLAIALVGCSVENVKPWQRGHLAKSAMIFGSDRLLDATDDHIYFSKEGTSGGRSFGAGGCGCN
jgi:hypothetical protein